MHIHYYWVSVLFYTKTCTIIILDQCMHFHFSLTIQLVLNATFNNISVISWRSTLLVEETWVPRENHRSVANHNKLYHIMSCRVWMAFELTTLVVICTDNITEILLKVALSTSNHNTIICFNLGNLFLCIIYKDYNSDK
jgi:hypothetical protein